MKKKICLKNHDEYNGALYEKKNIRKKKVLL